MELNIVVIGANAAGAKAAAKAKRINPLARIAVIDRGNFISYGACGIPYYVADSVGDIKELMSTAAGVVRDAEFFRRVKGVEVFTGTEAVGIDRQAQTISLYEKANGRAYTLPYDRLILATGSSAAIPPLENMGCPNILTLKTIEDAELVKAKAIAGRAVCIVGGGLIGLETAEALKIKGMRVTVVEMCDQLLPGLLDPEMAILLEKHLLEQGVEVLTSCKVVGFDGTRRVEKAITTRGEVAADLVILAPGVVPNITLAEQCGLKLGVTGAMAVDSHQRTSDPHIYACGDCCESTHLVTGNKVYTPLGSTANKQGRVAGINAAGGDATFAGILGTSIIRVLEFNAGKTGLLEAEARESGYDVVTVLSPAPDRAHFFPGAKTIALKLVADRSSGRILGVQAVGAGAVDKRIDTAVAAITFGATAEQLAQLDLAYAPPYAAAMDNLIVAADILKNKLAGHAEGITPMEVRKMQENEEDFILLDVRSPAEHKEMRIKGAKLIPLGVLREQLESLPRDKKIVTYCKLSLRGYEAQKILQGAGFKGIKFLDGGILSWPFELERS